MFLFCCIARGEELSDTPLPASKETRLVETLKHKETGEIIKGTVTEQKINNLTVLKFESGGTKFVNLDEWDIVAKDIVAVDQEAKPVLEKPAVLAPIVKPPETLDSINKERDRAVAVLARIFHGFRRDKSGAMA